MSDTAPLKRYLEAREALADGDRDLAAEAAEEAFGSKPNNPYIRGNLEKLLDHRGDAGDAALELVRVEMQRRTTSDDGKPPGGDDDGGGDPLV